MRWWAAFMLSGFLLRSLIPVGFMPMAGPGHSLRLVICDSYAPVPLTAAPMSMEMPGGVPMEHPAGGHPPHQYHGDCPYGSSPALGAMPTLAILPAAAQRLAEPTLASPQVVYFEVPPRAQSPRGPPA